MDCNGISMCMLRATACAMYDHHMFKIETKKHSKPKAIFSIIIANYSFDILERLFATMRFYIICICVCVLYSALFVWWPRASEPLYFTLGRQDNLNRCVFASCLTINLILLYRSLNTISKAISVCSNGRCQLCWVYTYPIRIWVQELFFIPVLILKWSFYVVLLIYNV